MPVFRFLALLKR